MRDSRYLIYFRSESGQDNYDVHYLVVKAVIRFELSRTGCDSYIGLITYILACLTVRRTTHHVILIGEAVNGDPSSCLRNFNLDSGLN